MGYKITINILNQLKRDKFYLYDSFLLLNNVILGVKIAAEPGLPLGFFPLQLTEQSSAVFSPETVVVNVAVIGRKQGPVGFLGPVHDGGHPLLVGVENRRYTLLTALFHQPDPLSLIHIRCV